MPDEAAIQKRVEEREERRRQNAAQRRRRRAKEREKRAATRTEAPEQPAVEAKEHGPGRPKVRQGVVTSAKGDKTIIVRIDVVQRHRRYRKILRSTTKLHAHDEGNLAAEGDTVRVVESRRRKAAERRRHRTYKKIVRKSTTLHAHDERNDASAGDTVRIVESRPLSRTKRWRLVEVVERAR